MMTSSLSSHSPIAEDGRAILGEMRVAVFGHRGFVGSAIADTLDARGQHVIRIDRATYERFRGEHFDLFINANGSSDRRLAAAMPDRDFELNVTSTMRSIADFTTDRYVFVSSIEVYEDPSDPQRTRESERINPTRLSAYGCHKYLAEVLVRRHAREWVVLRLGPLVGRGLRKNSIFDLLTRGSLFVNPESTLPYLGTDTAADAIWALRERPGEVFNLTGRGTVRLADVAAELNIDLEPKLYSLPTEHMNVAIDKVATVVDVPSSTDVVRRFIVDWRRGAFAE